MYKYKRFLFGGLFCAYLVFLAQQVGVLVGLYLSLLVLSFFVLGTPIISFYMLFMALFGDEVAFKKRALRLTVTWLFVLFFDVMSFLFFPIIFTKTPYTTLMYHLMLVPRSGMIPVVITGISLLYYWAVSFVRSSWYRLLLCLIGSALCSFGIYLFLKSSFFVEFVASLNSNAHNY
ncbi:hypothetical protein FJ366_01200 [Candidatus Dependentiae bacterium]|nr:hypothetical protein [Candidatus Dependentiae bacterium]